IHFDDGMRIAHRHRTERQRHAVNRQGVVLGSFKAVQRNARRLEFWHAHGDAEMAVSELRYLVAPGRAVEQEAVAWHGTGAHQPRGDAARTVAALLRGRTIAVPD